MLPREKQLWAVAAMLGIAGLSQAGDCPCRQKSAIRAVSASSDGLPPAPVPELNGAAPAIPSALPPPAPAAEGPWPESHPPPSVLSADPPGPLPVYLPQYPAMGGYQSYIGSNRWGMTPPPGTLGRTYLRRTTLIDDDMHPRVGVVMVKLPEQANVSGRGLKVKWTGTEWRLESVEPLVPGISHVYAVKAEWDTPSGKVQQTRWVRLVMGRAVDLEF